MPTSPDAFAPATLGRRERTLDLGWARVIEARHDPSLRLRPHEHEHAALTLVRRGGFELDFGRAREECRERSVFFKRGGSRHANRFGSEESRSFVVELLDRDGVLERESGRVHLPERSRLLAAGACALADRIESDWSCGGADRRLAIEGALLLMLADLAPEVPTERTEPAWLDVIDERLRQDLVSPPDMETLARETGVEAQRMVRTYRRHRGATIVQTLRRLRLEAALLRVTATRQPLAEIALDLGYFDQSHFTRAFRRRYGRTPSSLRN